MGGSHGEASRWSSSRRSRDHSRDYVDRDLVFPEGQWPRNAVLDAMSWALRRAAQSLFSEEIE